MFACSVVMYCVLDVGYRVLIPQVSFVGVMLWTHLDALTGFGFVVDFDLILALSCEPFGFIVWLVGYYVSKFQV